MPIAEPKWKYNTTVTNDSTKVSIDSLFFYEPPTSFQATASLIFP
jgi:hypothetical protein